MKKIGYLGDSRNKKASGVYQILNLINGKIYIGSSVKLSVRCAIHTKELRRNIHSNPKLQLAWNKYGEENFEFSVLEYCFPEHTFELEQNYINKLKPEYNIALEVGTPNTPKAGTPEAMERYLKLKDAIQRNGTYESDEYHEMMSGIMYERWQDDSYREARSKSTESLWNNEEYREKQKHSHRKINSSEREYIRRLIAMGVKMKTLAERFGVNYGTIRRINLGLH